MTSVHLTETGEPEQVEVITHVETTYAPVADVKPLAAIHEALCAKGVAPGEHYVDSGYMDVELLLQEQHPKGIRLVGSVRPDPRWQAQQHTSYAAADFTFDWQSKEATCPQGATSVHWTERTDGTGQAVVSVQFATKTCCECPVRAQCTHAAKGPRQVTVRSQAEHDLCRRVDWHRQKPRAKTRTSRFAALARIA